MINAFIALISVKDIDKQSKYPFLLLEVLLEKHDFNQK